MGGLYYLGLLIITFFTLYAQVKVWSAFRRYKKKTNSLGMTGTELVQYLARKYNIPITVEQGQGMLTDYYDPRSDKIVLSPDVAQSNSVAAIGVAAHEFGHALQKYSGYKPLILRNLIVPIVPIGTYLGYFMIMAGLLLNALKLAEIGLIFFAFMVVFTLITLPVEFNASFRAYQILKEMKLPTSELKGIKSVLTAAALTYVAAFLAALWDFIHFLLLVMSARDSRD